MTDTEPPRHRLRFTLLLLTLCLMRQVSTAIAGATPTAPGAPDRRTPFPSVGPRDLEEPLIGTRIDLVDGTSAAAPSLRIRLDGATLAVPEFGMPPDWAGVGATLSVFAATGETAMIPLRMGRWRRGARRKTGTQKTAAAHGDTITISAPTSVITLDEERQGALTVVLSIPFARYCAEFPAESIVVDRAGRFSARNGPRPARCPEQDSPIAMSVSPNLVSAPREVSFYLMSDIRIRSVTFDADGDGIAEANTSGRERQFTYTASGVYYPTLVAVGDDGRSHRVTTVVEVINGDAVDRAIRSAWNRMKDALRAGDIPHALTFITHKHRETYRRVFGSLTIPLSDIDLALGEKEIRFVSERGPIREYEMLRTKDGQTLSFAVIFKLEPDGVWRLDAF